VGWLESYGDSRDQVLQNLRSPIPWTNVVNSKPHPFISLLIPPKGKKLLSRDAHILGQKRMLTMLTLLVACFSQLDVVTDVSIIYDTSEATDTFLTTVMHTMMLVVARITLTPISGLLELLMKHNDIMTICHTRVSVPDFLLPVPLLIICDLSH
jgi:DNA topoisomerase 2-associated protein PAT1